MIRQITFRNKLGKPTILNLEILEEERKFIFCKHPEGGEPVLIARKDIIEIIDAKIEHKKCSA